MTTTSTSPGRPLYAEAPSVPVTGALVSSADDRDDVRALRRHLERDGYLYLPDFLPRDEVLAARADLAARLSDLGVVRLDGDRLVPGERSEVRVFDDVAAQSAPLQRLLYAADGELSSLFARLMGEAVRHYDFTWLRAYPRGHGTVPHMDSVFMNRGTRQLMTAWTPLGDISRSLGGVTVLSASHLVQELTDEYGDRDVDSFCVNGSSEEDRDWSGALTAEAVRLAESQGRRWLTADYLAGDVLLFPIYTTHAGLANTTDEVRLSCDSRYQPSSHEADARWVGPHPGAHSDRSKRGRIC